MTSGSHASPTGDEPPAPRPARGGWNLWRIGTPVMVLLSGALFMVSADNSNGTDLRPGRYSDLASVASGEARQYDVLQQRVAQLDDEVGTLTDSVDDRRVKRVQRKVAALEDPAGLVAREGAGISITLSDAPEDVINSTSQDLNLLVVHQQDIQAVVNALWKGGATAVTIQGQRVITTTGIKCEGNAVQLQGYPYPQPYVIEAVGDPTALSTAVDTDDYLSIYRDQAATPDISVGWDLRAEDDVVAPAYDGLLDLNYAEPLTRS